MDTMDPERRAPPARPPEPAPWRSGKVAETKRPDPAAGLVDDQPPVE